MITRLLIISVFGFLSCAFFASVGVDDGAVAFDGLNSVVAENRRKDRRGDRQENRDDKQDCRQEEGRVGDDKRECKQENRGDGDKIEDDDGDKGAEADA